jgi:hypothetical protein
MDAKVPTGTELAYMMMWKWKRWNEAQRAYYVQASIKDIGEEKAKRFLIILVKEDEAEYKRLKEMKLSVSIPALETLSRI